MLRVVGAAVVAVDATAAAAAAVAPAAAATVAWPATEASSGLWQQLRLLQRQRQQQHELQQRLRHSVFHGASPGPTQQAFAAVKHPAFAEQSDHCLLRKDHRHLLALQPSQQSPPQQQESSHLHPPLQRFTATNVVRVSFFRPYVSDRFALAGPPGQAPAADTAAVPASGFSATPGAAVPRRLAFTHNQHPMLPLSIPALEEILPLHPGPSSSNSLSCPSAAEAENARRHRVDPCAQPQPIGWLPFHGVTPPWDQQSSLHPMLYGLQSTLFASLIDPQFYAVLYGSNRSLLELFAALTRLWAEAQGRAPVGGLGSLDGPVTGGLVYYCNKVRNDKRYRKRAFVKRGYWGRQRRLQEKHERLRLAFALQGVDLLKLKSLAWGEVRKGPWHSAQAETARWRAK